MSARRGTLAWHPGLERLPERLGTLAPECFLVVFPPEVDLGAVGDRNPRPVDPDSLRRLLEDAFHGRPPGTYHHRDRPGAVTRTRGGST